MRRKVAAVSLIFIVPWVFSPMISDICKNHEPTDIRGCISTLIDYRLASSLSNTADAYYSGVNGQAPNYRKAMELHKKAAAYNWADSAYSEFYIAKMYVDGDGVTRDLKQAIEWYTKAAERGKAGSQYNIGSLYHREKSIQNLTLAHMWYSIASKNKIPDKYAAKSRDEVAAMLTESQLEESEQLVAKWFAEHP